MGERALVAAGGIHSAAAPPKTPASKIRELEFRRWLEEQDMVGASYLKTPQDSLLV